MKNLEETWRWYGPYDPIALSEIIQAGATGIVTALHDIPVGDVWSIQDIMNRKKEIEAHGLRWSVVESVNVHDDIKAGSGQKDMYLEKYIETIQNLAACGIDTVCYNFMPALDWTRTNLERKLKTGAIALEFDFIDAITFDLFILKRDGAEADYTDEEFALADSRNHDLSEPEKTQLANTILQGLPGGARGFTLHEFRQSLDLFHEVDVKQMRNNLTSFLLAIVPAAEAAGIRLAIHPDDPPFSLFGLPRVVSTSQDVQHILKTVNSPANGLCFCTGSYGASAENDVPAMAEKFADSIHFLHLRSSFSACFVPNRSIARRS